MDNIKTISEKQNNTIALFTFIVKCLSFLVIFCLVLPGCKKLNINRSQEVVHLGYSGMAQINTDTYIVVHDAKSYEEGARLGIICLRKNNVPQYVQLKVDEWKHKDGQPNDLESICRLPGRRAEFLAAESGYRKGKFGRLFHIRVQGINAQVLNVYHLPLIADNDEKHEGDNIEGLSCSKRGDGRILVILGERGGSRQYPTGVLRWGMLDLTKGTLKWINKYKEVSAPGGWIDPKSRRDISDLHLDDQGTLWSVAIQDASDEGPFRSVIYRIATIHNKLQNPLKMIQNSKASWVVDGFKVEALSGPTSVIKGCYLTFATEDESFNGTWRSLFPPIE